MESLGTSLIEALMILVEFMPILFGLSIGIPIFFFGDWDYGLIVGAYTSSIILGVLLEYLISMQLKAILLTVVTQK